MNEASANDFQVLKTEIIQNYIQSVLYIDDEWPEVKYNGDTDDKDESDLIPDVPLEDLDIQVDKEHAEAQIPHDLIGVRPLFEFQQAVNNRGILFNGLTYRQKDHFDKVVNLASRADIIVLDWELIRADNGKEAICILKKLVGKGLRFICIFTDKDRVQEVSKHLKQSFNMEDDKSEISEFPIQNLVIAIRTKKIGENSELDSQYAVEPKKLLDEAINALSNVYSGIVQLAMLEMMNAHREQLPKILDRIDSQIDLAFIAEATDEDSPISRNDAFIGILLDEWRLQLKQSNFMMFSDKGVKSYFSWLMSKSDKTDTSMIEKIISFLTNKSMAHKIILWLTENDSNFINWLKSGCPIAIPGINFSKNEQDLKKQRAAKFGLINSLKFKESDSPEIILNSALRLDVFFHQQRDMPKKLTQGTVLRVDEEDYLICMTPVCDAERPNKINYTYCFLMAKRVPAERLSEGKKTVSYIVIEQNQLPMLLKVESKPYIALRILSPVIREGENLTAVSCLPKLQETHQITLYPVAQLRFDHALALSASAGAIATRVGVDRVEFIRNCLS
ncbi:MAG: hypothetical protein GY795_31315 [Desulfobacterales bacterium]|nr:hypothetical protein [Desulfobacterales bacterium]